MKIINYSTIVMICMITAMLYSCKKNEEENNILENKYSGNLTVVYTKSFPEFYSEAKLGVEIAKDGNVTFTGSGNSDSFDSEAIGYELGKPALKVRMTGTLTFNGAEGEILNVGDSNYVMINVNTTINGHITAWGWTDEKGWMLFLDTDYSHEDEYNDGDLQFNLFDATTPEGLDIMNTFPEYSGPYTYGYNLSLVVF